ncbi:hypothetical protein GEMRC1_004408 [Eukaryota sp. GEM-RC1]
MSLAFDTATKKILSFFQSSSNDWPAVVQLFETFSTSHPLLVSNFASTFSSDLLVRRFPPVNILNYLILPSLVLVIPRAPFSTTSDFESQHYANSWCDCYFVFLKSSFTLISSLDSLSSSSHFSFFLSTESNLIHTLLNVCCELERPQLLLEIVTLLTEICSFIMKSVESREVFESKFSLVFNILRDVQQVFDSCVSFYSPIFCELIVSGASNLVIFCLNQELTGDNIQNMFDFLNSVQTQIDLRLDLGKYSLPDGNGLSQSDHDVYERAHSKLLSYRSFLFRAIMCVDEGRGKILEKQLNFDINQPFSSLEYSLFFQLFQNHIFQKLCSPNSLERSTQESIDSHFLKLFSLYYDRLASESDPNTEISKNFGNIEEMFDCF